MYMPLNWISGIQNCHVEGLNSYVIANRTSDYNGMLRVFHNVGGRGFGFNWMNALLRDGDYALAPHNHRQAIRLVPIRGHVLNVSFELDRRSHDHRTTEWVFESAILTGTASIRYKDSIDMYVRDVAILPIHGISLAAHEVHTVVASEGAAWLVVEGKPAPPFQQSLFYTRRPDYRLNDDGLYQSMEWWQLKTPERSKLFGDAMVVLEEMQLVDGLAARIAEEEKNA